WDKVGCDALDGDARKLLSAHRGDADAVAAIRKAMEPLGGGELPPPATPASHCGEGESLGVSCPMEESERVLSVCARPSLEDPAARLYYRYSRLGKVELQFPRGDRRPSEAFWYTSTAARATLRFENAKTAYELVVDDRSAQLFVYLADG